MALKDLASATNVVCYRVIEFLTESSATASFWQRLAPPSLVTRANACLTCNIFRKNADLAKLLVPAKTFRVQVPKIAKLFRQPRPSSS